MTAAGRDGLTAFQENGGILTRFTIRMSRWDAGSTREWSVGGVQCSQGEECESIRCTVFVSNSSSTIYSFSDFQERGLELVRSRAHGIGRRSLVHAQELNIF